ncbi:MAG: hypothetical protein U0V18_09915 [Anaerolineales bacterium]
MMKKYLPKISVTLLVVMLLILVYHPAFGPVFGMLSLLFSLAFSTYTIYTKHVGIENARPKIFKEVGVMVLTLVIILFLGGIAAMLANYQVSIRWGEVAGLVSAIGASFLVGYLVRKGMMRFTD